jgi:hypothetical protein
LVIILLLSLFALGFNAFLTNRKGQVQGAHSNEISQLDTASRHNSLVIDFDYDNSRIFLAQKQDHKAKVLKYSEIDDYDLLFEFSLSNIGLPLDSQIDRQQEEIFYIEENLGDDIIYSQELNKRKVIFSTAEQIKSLKYNDKYIYALIDASGLNDEEYDYKLLKINKLGISDELVRFKSEAQIYIDSVTRSSISLRDIALRSCYDYLRASEELFEPKCQPEDKSGVYEDFFVINKYSRDKKLIKPASYVEISQNTDDAGSSPEEKNQYIVYKRSEDNLIIADDVNQSELIYAGRINHELELLFASDRYLFLMSTAMESEERQLIRVDLSEKDKDTNSYKYDATNVVETDDFDYLGISDNGKYLMFNFYNLEREMQVSVSSFYIYNIAQSAFYEASLPGCGIGKVSCSFVSI